MKSHRFAAVCRGLVVGLFVLLGSGSDGDAAWQPQGRATGTASTIVVADWSSTGKRVLIGTPGSGVFLYDPSGPVTENPFKSRSFGLVSTDVTGLALDPNDPNRQSGWASTKGGVFQTTNGGLLWQDFGNSTLPAAAQNTTDIAVTWDGSNGYVWIGTSVSGIWRKRYRDGTGTVDEPWQPFDSGILGTRKVIRSLTAWSNPVGTTAVVVATTASSPILEPGTPSGVYRWKNGESTWTRLSTSGTVPAHNFLTASIARKGTALTALVGTDCASATGSCQGLVLYTPDLANTTGLAPVCAALGSTGKPDTAFFSVHHAYESGIFHGAAATNKGLFALEDPDSGCSAAEMGYVSYRRWNGPAGVVRVALDSTNGTPDELFIGAPGRGFYHGPPNNANGDVLRYSPNINDYNIKQVLYSPGFNGVCEFAGGGDSTVVAVSGTGGVYKAVDGNLTAPAAPCNYDGDLYFTRMNYFPNSSDTATVTTAAFAPSYVETGTVGVVGPGGRAFQNSLYVGTGGMGVLRSDDGAVSWTARNGSAGNQLPDAADVTALAIAPGKLPDYERILFAAVRNVVPQPSTGENRLVYMSTDAGGTWKYLTGIPRVGTPLAAPTIVSAIALPSTFNSDPSQSSSSPHPTRVLYVATEAGLFRGTNLILATGAITWNQVDFDATLNPDPPISALALSPVFDETQTNCGANLATCLMLVGTRGYGVYRSMNRGTSFVPLNGVGGGSTLPSAPNAFVNSIAIAPQFRDASPKVDLAYISVSNYTQPSPCVGSLSTCEEVWYLENELTAAPSSVTWTKRSLPNAGTLPPRVTSLAISPCFDGTIAPCAVTHPNSDQVLGGTAESQVFRLDHSEAITPWSASAGFHTVPANIQALALKPDSDSVILAGTRDAGIFLSYDKGQSFRPWSKGLLEPTGHMVKTVFSLGFSTDRTELAKDEYRLVAGTAQFGLFAMTWNPLNFEPGWNQAQFFDGTGSVPFDCGLIKDIRFSEAPVVDTVPGNRVLQEFRATVIPSNSCSSPILRSTKAVRSFRDLTITPDAWPALGTVWIADDSGLPDNGLQANSFEPNSETALWEGGKGDAELSSLASPVDPNILPAGVIIWGASGSGASAFSLNLRDEGRSPAETGCGTGGVYYSAWKKSGLGAWSRQNDDDGVHDLPCASTSYQAVYTLSTTSAIVGSSNAGVWLTRDDGDTWWQLNEGLSETSLDVRSFTRDADDNLIVALAGGSDGGTYFSDSGGFAWVPITTGLDSEALGALNLASEVSSGNTIYAAMSSDGIQALELDPYDGPPTAYFTTLAASQACASFVAADTLCDGTGVLFCNRTAGRMPDIHYSWDFGDGDTSTDTSPTHLYDEAGAYTVILTVQQGGDTQTDTYQTTVTVSSRIDATISSASLAGSQVTFNWTAPTGQTGWEVWGSTSADGTGRTQQASCAAACGGTASFTPGIGGGTLFFKLKVNSSTDACGSGYEW